MFGSPSGGPIQMPAGTTTYNFACLLPKDLPSSYEGKYGHIRYNAKAVLDRPLKSDKEFRVAFTVIKTEDLNAMSPSVVGPSSLKIERHFYNCCCFRSKPFNMIASIPFSGFVSGQTIEVSIKVNNESNIDCEGLKVALECVTKYESQSPRKKLKYDTLTVLEVFGAGAPASQTSERKILLVVPAISPTNTKYCKIINVSYQLKILAKVSGAHKNPCMTLPIQIGTIPLREQPTMPFINPAMMQVPHYDAIMNSSIPTTSRPSAPMMDLPPPSYQEAMRIVPEMEDADISVCNPLYPVWNFPSMEPLALPYGTPTTKVPLK